MNRLYGEEEASYLSGVYEQSIWKPMYTIRDDLIFACSIVFTMIIIIIILFLVKPSVGWKLYNRFAY